MKKTTTEKIEICPTCAGEGKVQRPPIDIVDETYTLIDCKCCLGSGRISVKTTIETCPFIGN